MSGSTNVSSDGVDASGNKASARVLRVLAQFADGTPTYGVSELSRELGMTKNMVHRALSTLMRNGYIVRDATGSRYQLAVQIVRLAGARLEQLDLPSLCGPFMEQMRDVTGETVSLAIPVGDVAVTIDGVRGVGDVARRVPLGRRVPLHASPAARAILAFLPDEEIAALLERPLQRFTEATLTDPEAVWDEVAAVRDRGFATSFDDHARGARGVAFPVLDRERRPHGSTTVGGPAERFTDQRIAADLPALQEIAAACNRRSRLYTAPSIVAELTA